VLHCWQALLAKQDEQLCQQFEGKSTQISSTASLLEAGDPDGPSLPARSQLEQEGTGRGHLQARQTDRSNEKTTEIGPSLRPEQ